MEELSREAIEGSNGYKRLVKRVGKGTAEVMMGWSTPDQYLDSLKVQKFDGSAIIDTQETIDPPTGKIRRRIAAREQANLTDKDMIGIHAFGEFLARAGKPPIPEDSK